MIQCCRHYVLRNTEDRFTGTKEDTQSEFAESQVLTLMFSESIPTFRLLPSANEEEYCQPSKLFAVEQLLQIDEFVFASL